MYGQGVTRGRVAILGIDAAINQVCLAVSLPDAVSSWFTYHYLSHSYHRVRNLGHGAHQKNLSAALVKTIALPVPTLPEQREIACMVQSLEAKITAEEKRRSAPQALFATFLHNLMSGGVRVHELSEVGDGT